MVLLGCIDVRQFCIHNVSAGVNEPPVPPNIARCIPLKGHGEGLLNLRQDFLRIIWKKAKIHTEDLRRKWFRM